MVNIGSPIRKSVNKQPSSADGAMIAVGVNVGIRLVEGKRV